MLQLLPVTPTAINYGQFDAHTPNKSDDDAVTRSSVARFHPTHTDGQGMLAHLRDNPHHHVAQAEFSQASLRSAFAPVKELGNGSFGTAFLCRVKGTEPATYVVVKLPNSFFESYTAAAAATRNLRKRVRTVPPPLAILLEHRMNKYNDSENKHHKRAVENFVEEFEAAELILEPQSLRDARFRVAYDNLKKDADQRVVLTDKEARDEEDALRRQLVGTPLPRVDAMQYLQIMEDLHGMRAYEGYHHIHPVLHLDRSLPVIVSLAADSSLSVFRGLILTNRLQWLSPNPDTAEPSALWVRIATQVASAIQYISACTDLAHVDIKPANILISFSGQPTTTYTQQAAAPTCIRCMLSDFGICLFKTQTNFHRFRGTAEYNPPWDTDIGCWMPKSDLTAQSLAYYQFITTVLDMLCFDGDCSRTMPAVNPNSEGRVMVANVWRHSHPNSRMMRWKHRIIGMPIFSPAIAAVQRLVLCIDTPQYDPRDLGTHFAFIYGQLQCVYDALNKDIPYYDALEQQRRNERRLRKEANDLRLEHGKQRAK
jgi:hypothetical protein